MKWQEPKRKTRISSKKGLAGQPDIQRGEYNCVKMVSDLVLKLCIKSRKQITSWTVAH